MKKGFLDGYKRYDTSQGYGTAKQWKGAFSDAMSTEEAGNIIDAQQNTPHAILGVAQGATAAAIKRAYRHLMMEWHPDRNQHRLELAGETTRRIIAAYTLLNQ